MISNVECVPYPLPYPSHCLPRRTPSAWSSFSRVLAPATRGWSGGCGPSSPKGCSSSVQAKWRSLQLSHGSCRSWAARYDAWRRASSKGRLRGRRQPTMKSSSRRPCPLPCKLMRVCRAWSDRRSMWRWGSCRRTSVIELFHFYRCHWTLTKAALLLMRMSQSLCL